MTSFSISAQIAAITDPRRPNVLADYAVQGPAMLGVIRVPPEGTDGFWERHDGGDELLIIIAGRLTMTLRSNEQADQIHHVGPGDVLLIPRGVAHSGKLHTPEVQILFVTPRNGNIAWSDNPDGPKRHE